MNDLAERLDTLPATPDAVRRLQAELSKLPQYEAPTQHYFADGMYCREVFRRKDVVIVGKVHRKEHFYIVTRGRVAVTMGDAPPVIHRAGTVLVSKPGTKRAVLALEDSVCVTVHRVSSTDLVEIERELVEDDPSAMFGPGNVPKHKELAWHS